MENECHFSPDRVHRYSLIHRFNLLMGGNRLMLWIGLNPSTADEQKLDPTLTRIARFSEREGMDGFWMGNLFGMRATDPKVMKAAPDPAGPENDAALLEAAAKCEKVVAAWGVHGEFLDRANHTIKLLADYDLWCVGQTKDGHPRHPLYVRADQPLVRWKP
ncbi:DUF1643 domain-containing protein [bacterium]|nr:DUF1643 domain-containing protein [bacterium]